MEFPPQYPRSSTEVCSIKHLACSGEEGKWGGGREREPGEVRVRKVRVESVAWCLLLERRSLDPRSIGTGGPSRGRCDHRPGDHVSGGAMCKIIHG